MREARLILPFQAIAHVEGQLKDRLIAAFNGFTVMQGHGAWDGGGGTVTHEVVNVYDIAMEDRVESTWALDAAVRWLFTVTDERAIYCRYPSGKVKIMKRPLETAAAVAT